MTMELRITNNNNHGEGTPATAAWPTTCKTAPVNIKQRPKRDFRFQVRTSNSICEWRHKKSLWRSRCVNDFLRTHLIQRRGGLGGEEEGKCKIANVDLILFSSSSTFVPFNSLGNVSLKAHTIKDLSIVQFSIHNIVVVCDEVKNFWKLNALCAYFAKLRNAYECSLIEKEKFLVLPALIFFSFLKLHFKRHSALCF